MDKPNSSTPHYERDTGECPVCSNIPPARNSCPACHGTGRKPSNILPFPASPTLRPATVTCDCVRTGRLLYGGDATPCPLCGGAGKITPQRQTEAYHLILRHAHELSPLHPSDCPTQPAGRSLTDALARSHYGVYCVMGAFRVYLEYAGDRTHFHAYAQDGIRPVGREGRMLIIRDTTLDAAYAEWAMMPERQAAIWWPLSQETAMARAAGVAGA